MKARAFTAFFLSLCLALALAASAEAQIRVQVGEVKETRTTGMSSSGLNVELRVMGDEFAETKSFRAVVKTAVDETGRDLINHEKGKQQFKESAFRSGLFRTFNLTLKNPARKAESIKELSGEVQFFFPEKDPNSSVVLESFRKQQGVPLLSESLKAAGIEITVCTKDQIATAVSSLSGSNLPKEAAGSKSTFSTTNPSAGGTADSITFQVFDRDQKLVSIELRDGSGREIKSCGESWTTSSHTVGFQQTRSFPAKVPKDASLVIHLATPNSLVALPFFVHDVALP